MSRHILVVYGDKQSPEYEVSKVTGEALAYTADGPFTVTGMHCEQINSQMLAAIREQHVRKPIDLIVNGFHGGAGENGELAQLLDDLGIPYTHSAAGVSCLAMDKSLFKRALQEAIQETGEKFPNLHFPASITLQAAEDLLSGPAAAPYCFVAKPNASGSSRGLFRISDLRTLNFLKGEGEITKDTLFEIYQPGLEVTCGVLGTGANAQPLPPTAIVKPQVDMLLDYNAKYGQQSVLHITPATRVGLNSKTVAEIARISYFAHTHFRFRTMTRCDFIVDEDGGIHFLEINANPGCTPTSFIPEQAAAIGLNFDGLLKFIVEDARIYWANRA
jgi:D-alanine-D-alanine ligase